MSDVAGDWLACPVPAAGAVMRLVAVPHAGGGPSALRPLAECLAPEVEVWVAQLPGRERRFIEPVATSLADIVAHLGEAVAAWTTSPFALFGHSMGGLVAFETARWLRDQGRPLPGRVLLSALPAAHLARREPPRHRLADAELIAWLRDTGGMPADALADSQLMALLLPIIRTDLQVCETYVHHPAAPLPCPLTVFAGADDPLVEPADVAAWRDHTTVGCDLRVLAGGHFFYLDEGWPAFAGQIKAALLACSDQVAGRAVLTAIRKEWTCRS
jgi:medium-chain acyl-[acyl-carrier-protein] hydrolase